MTAPPYMPLWIGDYLRDTQDFDALDHGAYLLLLMHAWTHGGTIPARDPELARIAKLSGYHWNRRRLKLLAKFVPSGANFLHRRVAAELVNALKKLEAGKNKRERTRGIHKESITESLHRGTSYSASKRSNGNGAGHHDEQAELPIPPPHKRKHPIPVSDELKYLLTRPPRGARKGQPP